jgi:NADH-quinone oxidoreductase subunit H
MMWVRWTLPRLRIDQVITMCWKYCVPIAAICFVGALFWQSYDLPHLLPRSRNRLEVREHWAQGVLSKAQRQSSGPMTAADASGTYNEVSQDLAREVRK